MSHLCWSSPHLPFTTTPEHALQSGPHDQLQEHPVHHEHLQALPVDKQRHQEPLWLENRRVAETRARQLPHQARCQRPQSFSDVSMLATTRANGFSQRQRPILHRELRECDTHHAMKPTSFQQPITSVQVCWQKQTSQLHMALSSESMKVRVGTPIGRSRC